MVSGRLTERNLFVLSVACVYCVCLPIFFVRVCFIRVAKGFRTPGLRAPELRTKLIRAPASWALEKSTKGSSLR